MVTAPEPIRILLIEDDAEYLALLRELIDSARGGIFRVTATAGDLASGIAAAKRGGVDAAVLDLNLPDSQELDTFRRLHEAAPRLPVIVLSGIDDEELAASAVHLGAQDYLVKSRTDSHLLNRALRYAVERSRSEALLSRERDLLETLLNGIPDRIYFKDHASRFIRINRALTDFFQLEKPEDAYGRTDADFFGHEHAEETLADERRVIETGEPILGKIECKTPVGGGRSWTLTTKLPLRDGSGRIVGTCGISREITTIKEMEEQRAAERNLLRSVIDHLPDAIFLKDNEGRYLLDNAAHWRLLGARGPEEVLGRTVFDFFPVEIAEYFDANDRQVLTTGEGMLNHEERVFDIHGRTRWQLTTKVPWRGEDDAILGVLCIARDITLQKESAEHLQRAYAEVAHSREEVLEAMARLQEAHTELRGVQLQLIDAEKMKSIGRLAAGVAHEVKNPLAVIRMGIEFLNQAVGDDADSVLSLKEMADAVQRADGVIRGLLDFSAPKQLELTRESLNAIIDRALQLVRGEMGPEMEVIRELDKCLPLLPLDAVKISQVFVNLLTNALHAMGETGTLTVRSYAKQLTGVGANISGRHMESFRVGGTIVVAEIDDTGHGIPEEKLGKIFEPFFTTKPTGLGTGLGLSVVKTIVDLHGATIDLRNLPECGTRATIMFQV